MLSYLGHGAVEYEYRLSSKTPLYVFSVELTESEEENNMPECVIIFISGEPDSCVIDMQAIRAAPLLCSEENSLCCLKSQQFPTGSIWSAIP